MQLAIVNAGSLLPAYQTLSRRLLPHAIAAVAETNGSFLRSFQESNENVVAADRLAELLNESADSFDAAVVHGELASRSRLVAHLLEAKKHVLAEFPVSKSIEEINQLLQIARDANVRLAIHNPLRFSPYATAIESRLRSGRLGDPGLIRIHHWQSFLDQSHREDWALKEVDLACWLMGATARTICIRDTGHSLQLHVGFDHDRMALLDMTDNGHQATCPYFNLTLIGSTGAGYADDHRNVNLVLRANGMSAVTTREDIEAIRLQLEHFIEAIKTNRPVEEEFAALRLADTISECGNQVSVYSLSEKVDEKDQRKVPSPSAAVEASGDNPEWARSFLDRQGSAATTNQPIPVAVLSVVKHCYIPRGIFSHARFVPAVVADDADNPHWVHERNQKFADEFSIPYVTDVDRALNEFGAQVAVVSSEAERHCDLSVRAAKAGLHVVQDKPMSTVLSECDRVIDAVEANRVKFLLWNRNCLPAVIHAYQIIQSGKIGQVKDIHVDFYFAKDAGPPIGTRQEGAPPMDWLEALKAAHATGADGGIGRQPMGELEVEGIYPLGYMHLLAGQHARRVFACAGSHFHQLHADNEVDDLATVSLEMSGGMHGTLSIGRIGNASHPDIGEIKIHVVGTEGSLVFSEARPEVGIYYRGQPELEFPNVRIANDNDWLLADNLVYAIDNDVETIMNARVGRAICATVQAAIESGKTGLPVDVPHR